MNPLFRSIAECLTGRTSDYDEVDNVVNEKSHLGFKDDKARLTAQDVANEVVDALFSAEKKGRDLEQKINNIVTEYGWTENIGVAIMNALESFLKKAAVMGQAMAEAFEKATKEAIDFAKEHPVYCTIIAIGILILLAPWVLELIGFGELGPIEGTFASAWQSRYAGYVPKDSLFAFFQRLGMIWKLSISEAETTGLQSQVILI